eukprot:559126-Pyramimonas_sp.AAC.1
MTLLPAGALQQTGGVLLRSWLPEMPMAGARSAGAAERRETRAVGAKFAKIDGPATVDGFARGDLRDLELEGLLIVAPAVCLPRDAGPLAFADY